ncbi:MAG: B12-binding domain-containing radical SAM protein [Magnetococcales bacterium]|nr:B12-binding domain-containing radical SAM protein [Magnetococcales bacterium]
MSAIARRDGHHTRLAVLNQHNLSALLDAFAPDVVAYSTMTPNEGLFFHADRLVRDWQARQTRRILRIMGGPHPTFFPEVLDKFSLDAICVGDGDATLPRVLSAWERGESLDGIPNLVTATCPVPPKETVDALDALPFADRAVFYEAAPDLQAAGIRSVQTQRGCPYKCTYCFNHAYNKMFKGEGRQLFRRRSVDNVIAELRHIIEHFPTARMIRFSDDVFVTRTSMPWLEEFARRYPGEIGLPYYCLIRPDAVTEEIAALLARTGCRSVGMSIESGDERIRNTVLKRNIANETLRHAFALCHRHGIRVYGNTMLGLPGTTLADDFNSVRFSQGLGHAAPTFSIFSPFPKTELTNLAIELAVLSANFDYASIRYEAPSVLEQYTSGEREQLYRLKNLAPLFCCLPKSLLRLLGPLTRLPLDRFYVLLGSLTEAFLLSRIFPGAQPRHPVALLKSVLLAIRSLGGEHAIPSGQPTASRKR